MAKAKLIDVDRPVVRKNTRRVVRLEGEGERYEVREPGGSVEFSGTLAEVSEHYENEAPAEKAPVAKPRRRVASRAK